MSSDWSNYVTPADTIMAGDVLFTSSPFSFGKIVSKLQGFIFGARGASYHVAFAVSPFEIVEISPFNGFTITPLDVWLLRRRGNDDFLLLRSEREVSISKLYSAVRYREGEAYHWGTFLSFVRRRMDGKSICSSFVQKVVFEIGLVSEAKPTKNLMPNELLTLLLKNGWKALSIEDEKSVLGSSEKNFLDHRHESYIFCKIHERLFVSTIDFLGRINGSYLNKLPEQAPTLSSDLIGYRLKETSFSWQTPDQRPNNAKLFIKPLNGLMKDLREDIERGYHSISYSLPMDIKNWSSVSDKENKVGQDYAHLLELCAKLESYINSFLFFESLFRSSLRNLRQLGRFEPDVLYGLTALGMIYFGPNGLKRVEENNEERCGAAEKLISLLSGQETKRMEEIRKKISHIIDLRTDTELEENEDTATFADFEISKLRQEAEEFLSNSSEYSKLVESSLNGALYVEAVSDLMKMSARISSSVILKLKEAEEGIEVQQ